ncbi:hypothetical protein ABPG73_017156 [Tetrahymena malaccensis]
MKLAILLQAIKGIDIYGVPVGVNFKNDEIHKTSFGALISAVIFILITLQTYYSGQDLIYKNNPQVITSEQYVRNPERMVFDKVNQIVMMGFSTPSSQYINDPSIIQVSAILSTVQKVLNSTTQQYDTVTQAFPLKVRSCSINDVKVEKVYGFFSKLPLSSLFCFDDNQQIYVEGDYSGDFYSRVDVSFNQCVNSTKAASVVCQPQKAIDKVLSNISFLVYMMDKILDPNNYEQPFDYQGFNIQAQASNQQSQAYTAYFENYYIESDVGLLQKDVKKLKDFKFINTDTTIIYNNPSLVMKFSMRPYKNRQALMQRRYMKFTDLLAQIGGVLKFLTVAGFILCHPYAKLNLTKEVINCVFDFDENQSARKQGKKEANTEMKDKNNDDQESFQLDSVIIKKLAFKEKLSQLNSLNLSQKSQENQLFTSNKFGNQIQQKAKFKKNFQKNNSAKNSSENWFIKKEIGNSDQSQITQSQDQSAQIPNSQQPIQSFQQQKPSQNLVTIENSEENENYIKSDQQEDLFKDRVISRIKKLINPLKQKAQLTMKDYLSHFSNCSQNKTNLMQEGIKKIQNRLDIQNILCQLQEIEKLKKIVLDEDQIKLFEIIPRPVLKNTQNKVQEDTKNQFFDNKEKPEDEKVNDAYNSLCNILKKQKKSQRDLQLIQLLDNNMYLSLQKLGILSNKNEIPLEQKYQHADEIVEKTNLFNQLSLLNRPQQQEETNFLNDKSDTQEEEGVKSDTQEEEGVKSDTQEEVGAIKGIDIYGVPVGVNFNNNQIHRTSFGALISACIFIVIVIQCYYSGLDLKSKTNPQVITSEQYVSTPERMVFDKVQQVIMMGFSTISSQYIYDPSIIQASATTATVKKVFNETTQQYDTVTQKTSLKIRPCTTNDVKVEKLQSFFSKLPLSNLFCFDDNQQVIVEGDYSGDSYSRVDVSFNQCVNSTKVGSVVCKPQKAIDKVLSNINFLVYMMDKILDPSNYETPFDYQGINLQVQATNQQSQNYIAYFENYYIESDVGLISKDIQRLRDFIFAGTDTTVLYNNPSLVMQFSMKPYKNKQILMQRSYMKLTDLLAQIGGVLKFLTVFGFIMCHPYAKLNLTQDLINSVFDCEENRQDSSQQKYVNSEQKNQKMKDQDSCQLESFLMKKLSLKYPQNHQYQNQIELNTDNSPKSKHESLKSQRSKRIAQQQNTKFNLRTSQNINFCQQNQSNQFNQKGSCIPDQNQQNLPLEQPCPRTPQLKQPIVNNLNQQEPLQCKEAANNDEKKKQNDINNESKDDLFKNRIVRRIQKLINPLKQKVQLTMKGYISHYSNCSQNNKNLIQEGINKIQHRLDIQNILHQLQEIEKLKKIVLDEDQIKLFEILPRPVLKNSQNKTQSDAKNQFYDSKNQSQEEQVNDAYNSLCKILNKQKKSQRDLKLIQLLDNELYLSLLKLGFLSHTKDNLLESKYDNNDEILENSSAILQSSTLKKYTQYDNLKSDNSEDINFYSNKLEVSDEGAKSDFYSNFYKKYNKNSLNLS